MKKVLPFIKYGAIGFAVIGLIMTVCNFVGNELGSITGLKVIFGYAETYGSMSVKVLNFSFMALLAVVLPLIGALSVLFKNRIVRIVGAVLMLAGIVLCFFMPNFLVFAMEGASAEGLGLQIGVILAVIFYALGLACNVYAVLEDK